MRILVASDTHGDFQTLKRVVLSQPTADVIIHLGDGEEQADAIKMMFPNKMVVNVKGNCDWGSTLPMVEIKNLEGKKIMATHGHLYNVKMGYLEAIYAAREQQADVLLFGHTHMPFTYYDDGLYIMNPGSCHGSYGTYGILDITKAGIVTNVIKVH